MPAALAPSSSERTLSPAMTASAGRHPALEQSSPKKAGSGLTAPTSKERPKPSTSPPSSDRRGTLTTQPLHRLAVQLDAEARLLRYRQVPLRVHLERLGDDLVEVR